MPKGEDSHSLLEPEFHVKTRHRKTGFYFFIMGVTTALSVAALSLALYQVVSSRQLVHVASGGLVTTWPPPPPHGQVTKVARYVVHTSDWASIATISTLPAFEGFPFDNILSISDGPINQSSGIPYMYLTAMDFTGKDLMSDPRATLVLSQAQSDYCKSKAFDPEDPRCARIILTGNVVVLENGTAEASAAQTALFTRHPVMESWPTGHHWFFCKLDIKNVYVLDFFGGAALVDLDEYYKTDPFP